MLGPNREASKLLAPWGPQCASMARMGGERTSQWTVCRNKHIQATDATDCIVTLGWEMKVAQYCYNEDSCSQRLSPLVKKHPLERGTVADGSITDESNIALLYFRNCRHLP